MPPIAVQASGAPRGSHVAPPATHTFRRLVWNTSDARFSPPVRVARTHGASGESQCAAARAPISPRRSPRRPDGSQRIPCRRVDRRDPQRHRHSLDQARGVSRMLRAGSGRLAYLWACRAARNRGGERTCRSRSRFVDVTCARPPVRPEAMGRCKLVRQHAGDKVVDSLPCVMPAKVAYWLPTKTPAWRREVEEVAVACRRRKHWHQGRGAISGPAKNS